MKHDKTRITISIPADVVESIDQIAEAEDRSRSWTMTRAARCLIEQAEKAPADKHAS